MALSRLSYRLLCKSYLRHLLTMGYRRIACLFTLVVGCMVIVQIKLDVLDISDIGFGRGDVINTNRSGNSPLLLLYWTTVFDRKDWKFGDHLQHCPHLQDKCIYSTDRGLYSMADVMLLHMRDPFKIPRHRPSYQKWVFGLMESPVYTGLDLHKIRGLFNLTMTYKRSSNIPWMYGTYVPIANSTLKAQLLDKHRRTNFAAGKKYVAAWFTSHCHPQSKREEYVKNLQPYLDVHVYGSCGGEYSCPKNDAERCLQKVNTEYKFTFAFENSLCEDYITEKVWKILQRQVNVVPVVMGFSKYAELLPPHSFVDVGDFSSPEALAAHLKRVDANDTLYNEYFRWRTGYTCTNTGPPFGCQVCDYMLKHRHERQTVDVEQFWSVKTNCVTPKEYNARWPQPGAKKSRKTKNEEWPVEIEAESDVGVTNNMQTSSPF